MPKWLKVTLIVCVSIFALMIIAGGITFLVFINSEDGKELLKNAQTLVKDSETTAKQVQEMIKNDKGLQDCIDLGKKNLDACDEVLCYVQVKLFLKTCLSSVKQDQRSNLCQGVPEDETKMVQWDLDYCERYNPKSKEEHEVCGRMLAQEIYNYCNMPIATKTSPDTE